MDCYQSYYKSDSSAALNDLVKMVVINNQKFYGRGGVQMGFHLIEAPPAFSKSNTSRRYNDGLSPQPINVIGKRGVVAFKEIDIQKSTHSDVIRFTPEKGKSNKDATTNQNNKNSLRSGGGGGATPKSRSPPSRSSPPAKYNNDNNNNGGGGGGGGSISPSTGSVVIPYAGAKFSAPPSPKSLPKPPSSWMITTVDRNNGYGVAISSILKEEQNNKNNNNNNSCSMISDQLKLLLNVQA